MTIPCTPSLTLLPLDIFVEQCLSHGLLADILSECSPDAVDAAVRVITTEEGASFFATNEAVWLATSLFVLSQLFRDSGTQLFGDLAANDFAKLKEVPHWRALVEYLLAKAKPPASTERGSATTQDVSALAAEMLRTARFAKGPELTCGGVTTSNTIRGQSVAFSIARVGTLVDGSTFAGIEFLAADGPLSMPLPPVDERRQLAVVTAVFSAVGRGVLQAVGEVRPAQIVSDIDPREFRQMYTTIDTQVAGALGEIKTADDAQAVAAATSGVYINALDQLTTTPGSPYAGKPPAYMKALGSQYIRNATGDENLSERITKSFNDLMRAAKLLYDFGTDLRRRGAPVAELHDAQRRLIELYKHGASLLTLAEVFMDFDDPYVESFGYTRSLVEWSVDFGRVPQIVPLRGRRVRVSEFPAVRSNPGAAALGPILTAACTAAPAVCLVAAAVVAVAFMAFAYLMLNKLISSAQGIVFDIVRYIDTASAARSASLAKSKGEEIDGLTTQVAAQQALLIDSDTSNDAAARARIDELTAQIAAVRAQKAEHEANAARNAAGASIAKETAAAAHKRGEALPDGLFGLTPNQITALKWGAIALGGLWVAKKLDLTK